MKVKDSSKIFFETDEIKIINDDFLKTNSIKESSVDLRVTSPPYHVDINYYDYNDSIDYQRYLIFTELWLKKTFTLLKEDERFCLNIPFDKNKGGQQSVYADIINIAKKIGFKYHSTIIWNEQNISKRTAWGSSSSVSAHYVIAPIEMIVVLYKLKWKKNSGSKLSDISKDEFVEWTNGVWTFPRESKKRVHHPALFLVELPRRCINIFSYVGDTILDSFLGSGTTSLATLKKIKKESVLKLIKIIVHSL